MLYFADEQPFFDTDSDTPIHRGPAERMADLAPLVRTYDSGLDRPLDEAELTALPYSLARQPLWTCITWAIDHPDHDRARSDALDTAPAVARALAVLDDPDAWSHAFAC